MRWLATGLIFLVGLCLLFLGFAINYQLSQTRNLIAEGRQTQGTVIELVAPRRSTAYTYGYTYTPGTSLLTQTKRSISFSERHEVQPGTKIRVWYDPAKPERATTQAELNDQESWANRFVFPLIGAALVAWALLRIFRRKPD